MVTPEKTPETQTDTWQPVNTPNIGLIEFDSVYAAPATTTNTKRPSTPSALRDQTTSLPKRVWYLHYILSSYLQLTVTNSIVKDRNHQGP